jgi:(2R)-3-sulfolactate dehydrogenase (NADP+)
MRQRAVKPGELKTLVTRAFVANATAPENAVSVATALVGAEVDGQVGHGLSRVPAYAAQARSGKVNGRAVPRATRTAPAAVVVDAADGFAYPAIDLALREIAQLAPATGIAAAAIHHSHHFGVAGRHVERLAEQGLIGLIFGNSPKAIAPWGGKAALFGTNPIAFAAPRRAGSPLVIDLSLSKVARGKIMVAAQRGEAIPEGWALDAEGKPTTDAKAALDGAMLPMGDAKGAALVLMVEILAAALTGSSFGFEAASFFDAEGPPPRVGQFLIGIEPKPFAGLAFVERVERLIEAILDQPGARLPGVRRLAERDAVKTGTLRVDAKLLAEIETLAKAAK